VKTSERLVSLERRIWRIEALFDGRLDNLYNSAQCALTHIIDLEDAWERGALSHDGRNSVLSNRNVNVRVALAKALHALAGAPETKQGPQ
jgi:hypothetical protein